MPAESFKPGQPHMSAVQKGNLQLQQKLYLAAEAICIHLPSFVVPLFTHCDDTPPECIMSCVQAPRDRKPLFASIFSVQALTLKNPTAILFTGSAVAAAFHFIQFCLGLNFLQSIVWAILVVIPFMLQPPTSFSWSLFRNSSPKYLLQGYGIGQTFLLYGMSSASLAYKAKLPHRICCKQNKS